MSLAPSPSASRGELVLQPAYFTSSLFVEPFRADVQSLIDLFVSGYTQAPKPFAFFKQLWTERGWIWFHLKVFDARTRETFLRVTCRLFVGASCNYWLLLSFRSLYQRNWLGRSHLCIEWSRSSRSTPFSSHSRQKPILLYTRSTT